MITLYPSPVADTGMCEVQFKIDPNYTDKLKAIFAEQGYAVDKIGNSLFLNYIGDNQSHSITEPMVHDIHDVIQPYLGDHNSYISIVYRPDPKQYQRLVLEMRTNNEYGESPAFTCITFSPETVKKLQHYAELVEADNKIYCLEYCHGAIFGGDIELVGDINSKPYQVISSIELNPTRMEGTTIRITGEYGRILSVPKHCDETWICVSVEFHIPSLDAENNSIIYKEF